MQQSGWGDESVLLAESASAKLFASVQASSARSDLSGVAVMLKRALPLALLVVFSGTSAIGQRGPVTAPATIDSMAISGANQYGLQNINLWAIGAFEMDRSPLEGQSGSVSAKDVKAPGHARNEYNKGYLLLMRKDPKGAVQHLTTAISEYSDFVAARNALGLAYMQLGQSDSAREQFAKAASLDDHLPGSFLNLGSAQLALKDYPSAEQSVQKASSLAPLDLEVSTALTYA